MIKLERSRRRGFGQGAKLDNLQWREYDAVETEDPPDLVRMGCAQTAAGDAEKPRQAVEDWDDG